MKFDGQHFVPGLKSFEADQPEYLRTSGLAKAEDHTKRGVWVAMVIVETLEESTWLERRDWWVSTALGLHLILNDQRCAKFGLMYQDLKRIFFAQRKLKVICVVLRMQIRAQHSSKILTHGRFWRRLIVRSWIDVKSECWTTFPVFSVIWLFFVCSPVSLE